MDGSYQSRDFNQEIEQIDNLIEIHERAVNSQNQRLTNLKAFCSKEVCDELQADYGAIIQKMRESVGAIIAAIELEQKFVDELQRHEIDVSYLGRVFLPRVLDKSTLEAFVKSIENRRS